MPGWEGENESGAPGAGGPDTNSASEPAYQVGYGRPPLQTRFKPGRSGNPKGRPKGSSNHRTTVERVMKQKVSVREGEKTRRVTKFEAMLQAQASKGMKGDARSAGMVINVMSKAGLLSDQGCEVKANEPQSKPIPEEIRQSRLSDCLFDGLDGTLLTEDELVELAGFAEWIDASGLSTLTAAGLKRIQELIDKGKGTDRPAA